MKPKRRPTAQPKAERKQEPEGPVAATATEEPQSGSVDQKLTEADMFEGLLNDSSKTNRPMDDMEVYASMCLVAADLDEETPLSEPVRVEAPPSDLDESVHAEESEPNTTPVQQEILVHTNNVEDSVSTEIDTESDGLHVVEYQSLYRASSSSSTEPSRPVWRTIATGLPTVHFLDKDYPFEAKCHAGVGRGAVSHGGVRLVVSVGDEMKKWTAEADVGSFISEF